MSDFSDLSNDFQPIFYLNIKFWMKNGKPVGFSSLSLDFLVPFFLLSFSRSLSHPLHRLSFRYYIIDMTLKTGPHRFYWKPEKPVGFWYKIQFLKVGEKPGQLSSFSGLSVGFSGLSQSFTVQPKFIWIFWGAAGICAIKYETMPLNQDNTDNKLTENNNRPIKTAAT
jgi:hypothetical protein